MIAQSSCQSEGFVNTRRKLLKKQKLNFSLCALFHMKTRISLKYFVSYCGSHDLFDDVIYVSLSLSKYTWKSLKVLVPGEPEIFNLVLILQLVCILYPCPVTSFIKSSWSVFCFKLYIWQSLKVLGTSRTINMYSCPLL